MRISDYVVPRGKRDKGRGSAVKKCGAGATRRTPAHVNFSFIHQVGRNMTFTLDA